MSETDASQRPVDFTAATGNRTLGKDVAWGGVYAMRLLGQVDCGVASAWLELVVFVLRFVADCSSD